MRAICAAYLPIMPGVAVAIGIRPQLFAGTRTRPITVIGQIVRTP